jgi:hypothetical protein
VIRRKTFSEIHAAEIEAVGPHLIGLIVGSG